MITIINNTDIVYFRNNRWWAENGMICCEDKRTGTYQTMTVSTALKRLEAVSDMVGRSRISKAFTPQQRHDHIVYIEDMVALCRKARSQGSPEMPGVVADKVADGRKARIIVPGGINAMPSISAA